MILQKTSRIRLHITYEKKSEKQVNNDTRKMSMSIMNNVKGEVHVLEKIQKHGASLHVIFLEKSQNLKKKRNEDAAKNWYVMNIRQIDKSKKCNSTVSYIFSSGSYYE